MGERGRSLRLLILGLNYAPEEIGIGPYTAQLAQGLVARGHRVTAIAGNPYYPQWRHWPGFAGVSDRMEEGVRVSRVPHHVPRRPGAVGRVVQQLSFAAAAHGPAMRLAASGLDAVLAIAPPLLAAPVAILTARRAGARLWLHVQDFEAEAARATGLLGARGAKAALAIERRLLGAADLVSTISPQMVARLAEKGIAPARLLEMRNWTDPALDFAAADGTQLRAAMALGTRRVALYSGNLGRKQGLDTLVDTARLLRGREDLMLLICGEGPERAALEAAAADLPNIRFADLRPRAELAALLALADVHLLPQIASAADLVLPSKLTNMLASGRPVVAGAAPGTGLAEEIAGCGIAVTPGDGAAFAAAITHLLDTPALSATYSAGARRRAADRWGRETIIDTAERRLRHLCGGTP